MVTSDEKYRDLELRALAILRRPSDALGLAPLVGPELRVILWRHPAFEPYQSWSLIEDKKAADLWVLRRVTWNRSEDYGRAADPVRQAGFMMEQDPRPTLDVVDVRVSATFVARTLDSINALEKPALCEKADLGIDGIVNGLAIDHQDVQLEWWCDGPPEWRRFTDGVERIRLRLESTIAG